MRALTARLADPIAPTWTVTSRQCQPIQPPAARLPDAGGPPFGRNLLDGACWRFDPWALYQAGHVTSSNRIIVGAIGRRKSTAVKTMLLRSLAQPWSRRAVVLDVKGEYGPFAAAASACRHGVGAGGPCGACGGTSRGSGLTVTHIAVGPGQDVALNPLDVGDGLAPRQALAARTELVCALVEVAKEGISQPERAAVGEAVRWVCDRGPATLADVVEAMLAPAPDQTDRLWQSAEQAAAEGRDAALALDWLVNVVLAGAFSRPTSPQVDMAGDVVVVDLSAVHQTPAQTPAMTCVGAFVIGALRRHATRRRTWVEVEEAWALLRHPATALYFASLAKLSRQLGVSVGVVVHRLADLRAVGASGTVQERLARGLLAECEIRMIGGQADDTLDEIAKLCGLNRHEQAEVRLGRRPAGSWLVQIGDHSGLVQHVLAPVERPVVDTDQAMRR